MKESYAYFKVILLGERKYSVSVENLTLTLDESTTPDNITIENMVPKPDSEGVMVDAYTFTLTNHNKIQVGFAIFLDDVAIENEVNRISDAKVRYQLIKNGEETIGTLSELGTYPLRIMDIGKMEVEESNSYSLRFWIDENAGNEILGQELSLRLRVVVTQPEVIDRGEIETEEEYKTVGSTGGNSKVTLAEDNLPAHSHTVPSLSGTTSSAGSHSHTVTAKGQYLLHLQEQAQQPQLLLIIHIPLQQQQVQLER